jgi:hypothetical protein
MKTEKKKTAKPMEEAPAVPELREPMWAVVTFDDCAARDLTYTEAETRIRELEAAKVAGLCIVPNAVADRIPKR